MIKFDKPFMVFKYNGGDFVSYSVCFSTKQSDGSYSNRYVNIYFADGVKLANRCRINILDGYIFVNRRGDLCIKCLDFEEVKEDEGKN